MKQSVLTAICLLISLVAGSCKGLAFKQVTENMLPTIAVGDVLFCDPVYYTHSPVERGHIVVIYSPDKNLSDIAGEDTKFIFRIVGIGGDEVRIENGRVFVNEKPIDGVLGSGEYPSKNFVKDYAAKTVPPGEYFLLGDNLPGSNDSRYWRNATIKKEMIYGKVILLKDGKTGEQREL